MCSRKIFLSCLFLFSSVLYTFCAIPTKKAIVVGATSGMGRQVAKRLALDYEVGLIGRRIDKLESLRAKIPTKTYIKQFDVTQPDAPKKLCELIEEMGGLDLILISISAANDLIGKPQTLDAKMLILETDLKGFIVMAETALAVFEAQGSGHLVGISSIDGIRGNANCPVYSASKAALSTYLEAIRNKMAQNNIPNIYVTDIIPGWVEVEAIDVNKIPGVYWVAKRRDAADQIYDAIKAKNKTAYITKRWRLIAWLLSILPDFVYNHPRWKIR